MKRFLLLVSCVYMSFSVFAQTKWSLQDCLSYAQENNLDIKSAYLGVESSKKNLFQSKASLLPSLNGSASETRRPTNHGQCSSFYDGRTGRFRN